MSRSGIMTFNEEQIDGFAAAQRKCMTSLRYFPARRRTVAEAKSGARALQVRPK
jgi:hypothetical protein